MAKQDDWARITLRLPADLHAKLVAAAATASLNNEIVDRLYESFEKPSQDIVAARAAFAEERRWMWGIVERAVTGRVTPDQVELLQPLFPDRRAKRSGEPSQVSLDALIEQGRVLLGPGSPDPDVVVAWSALISMVASEETHRRESPEGD